MTQIFTREQFYELVWSKPMTHLAKQFAISDVALHKICKKHDIPNPPLGWWARKAAGQKVKQTPLPDARSASRVTIASGNLGSEPSNLATVREQARVIASESNAEDGAQSHPIIDKTIASLRKAKSSDIGIVTAKGAGLIACEIASSSIDRLAVGLPLIIRAASLQGFELVPGEQTAVFKSKAETLGFSITEIVKREKHVLTDPERAKLQAWEKKQNQAAQRNSWDSWSYRPQFPEWDYSATGLLSFEFEHNYFWGSSCRPRRSFRDAKVQRLENMASDIAVGLAVLAAAKTEDRLRRQEEERKRQEEYARRERAARIKHIEERRVAGLTSVLKELDELDRLRRYIALLIAEVSAEPTPRLTAFLAWSREHLANREKRLSPIAIEGRFAADHLFGDDDDHAFSTSRW